MSKLVDKERLARLAQALDTRMKDAVKAEKTRALAAEAQALADAKAYTNTEIGKVNSAAEGLGERVTALEQFKTTQEQNNADQSAAINAKVAQADYDAKMEALDAEDARIAGLVAAEETRAKGVEAGFETRIAANEAFVAAQPAIDAEQDRRIKVLEDDAPVKQAAIEAAQDAADDAKAAADAAQADANALEQRLDAEGGLVDRIEANEDAIEVLNGAVDVEGSVKKQIQDAIDEVNGDAEALAGRVEVLEGAVADMKDATKEGSLAKQIADEAAARDAEDTKIRGEFAAADQALETRVNQKIADDIATESALRVAEEARIEGEYKAAIAQEVIDRNAAIEVEKQRAEGQEAAIRQEFVTADNALKADLQAEIDADVKVVADELAKQKDAAQEGTLAHQIATEKARMDAFLKDADVQQNAVDTLKELQDYIDTHGEAAQKMVDDISTNAQAIAKLNGAETLEGSVAYAVKAEADRAKLAEKANADAIVGLDERIDALEEVTNEEGILAQAKQYADDKDAALKQELQNEIDGDVAAEAALREAADNALDGRIKVFEVGGAQDVAAKEVRLAAAEGEIDDLQEFVESHDHTVIEQGIADNKAAIEAEVKEGGARDAAIAKALEDYSTTEEVKTILTNVVATLNLSIEDDQVVLKLGGAEGVTLSQTALDMATDDDINEIIAGLDAPAGE